MSGPISLHVNEADGVPLEVEILEDGDLCLTFGCVDVYMRSDQAEAIAEVLAKALANMDGKGS